ncbi:3-keto-disaccharide hydrolase [Haloferula sargassicola]|uniref:3-keto-alpha-glucoside-1,2-lyase/3-keto-2-hydroxy-glucal hydratase domain-containing protein n=1 Tax=Haloferula sargassicola TaxID=490096 RepID=A0ABP9ULE0_9BACT
MTIQSLAASLSLTLAPVALSAETVKLFNGEDLAGWSFDLKDDGDPAKVWSVKDGILFCTGSPVGVMRTKEPYRDYELVIEWRWTPGSDGGNSGLLLYASTPRTRDIWPKCVEVQLESGSAGDFWMLGETLEAAHAPEDRTEGAKIPKFVDGAENPPGEWNTMKVRAEAGELIVWINGKLVNQGKNLSARKGAIGLQSEGAGIQFRKIELTPVGD